MGKRKRKNRQRHHPAKGHARQARRAPPSKAGNSMSAQTIGAVLPALIIALAVLWDWALRLSWEGWNGHNDISVFVFTGQRLVEGLLNWTEVFYDNKLLVNQFLFYPAGLLGNWFNPYKVWHLTSMAGCLVGAWAVYIILRDVFSPQRGFAHHVGQYAGIYGAAFTLYLFSAAAYDGPHHINALAVSMALAAAALVQCHVGRASEAGARVGFKAASVLLLSCLCASLAVGIRPYLLVFVGVIPAYAAIAAQLASGHGRIDWRAAAKLFIAWNAGVALMTLAINVLPFVLAGEWHSFTAGLEVLAQQVAPSGLEWSLHILAIVYNAMGPLSLVLFYCWAGFLLVFLTSLWKGWSGPFASKATALALLALAAVAPLSILGMMLTKNFWAMYTQFFLPFISIGAVSLFALLHGKRQFRFLFRQKAIAVLLALVCVSPLATELQTKPGDSHRLFPYPPHMAPTVQNLDALLDEHGLEAGDFLAPYNQYVHVRFNQHRHGFPNAIVSVDSTLHGWYSKLDVPAKFRIPTDSQQYCQMLDDQGPALIVFFAWTINWGTTVPQNHLANCSLSQYDFHNISTEARQPSDVAFYFLRKQV